MSRSLVNIGLVVLAIMMLGGCAGNSEPTGAVPTTRQQVETSKDAQRVLWGLWDCVVNPASGSGNGARVIDEVREKLPNDLVWLFSQQSGLPLVTLELVVKAGALQDPKGKEGLANLTASLLLSGTKSKSATQIAQELEVHESTISRAVASKTVQLPNKRIIPLSEFFDRSLNIRTVLKDIIEGEKSPLSDTELVEILKVQGYQVARRTVAKYRAMEGILPAHLRRPSR